MSGAAAAYDDHAPLAESAGRFVADHYPFAQWQRIASSGDGFSRAHWKTMAELGWLALALPEAHGGLALGAAARAALAEQLGRGAVLEPWFSTTVLGAELIVGSEAPAQHAAMLPAVGAGRLLLAFAGTEAHARFDLTDVRCRAERRGEHYVLNGAKVAVLDGPSADVFLVLARTGGDPVAESGLSLLAVPRDTPGLACHVYPTVDHRRCCDVTFTDAAVPIAARMGAEGAAWPAVERAVDHALCALCAEAIGAMDVLIAVTIEHLKTRRQFGRALAQFQVLRHRVADMIVAHERCRSLLGMAIAALDDPRTTPPQRATAASAAKFETGRAGRFIGESAIQLHGAIAVTDELHAGHYVKRLMAIDTLLGDADFHLRRFQRHCA